MEADAIIASLVGGSVGSPSKFLIWTPQKPSANTFTSVLLEEDPDERIASWNEVSTETIDPEKVIIQDILIDGDGEVGDKDGSDEVEVVLPDVTFISLCPVSWMAFVLRYIIN